MSSNRIAPCRSLLAGDLERTPTDHTLNRLPVRQAQGPEPVEGQAGSYIPTKPKPFDSLTVYDKLRGIGPNGNESRPRKHVTFFTLVVAPGLIAADIVADLRDSLSLRSAGP